MLLPPLTNLFAEITIVETPITRTLASFNPTILSASEIVAYDLDKYMKAGQLNQLDKLDAKYKFVAYNSSIKVSNFYFKEPASKQTNIDSLFRLHLSPFKWTRITNCIFDLQNQLVFSQDGNNLEVNNVTMNVTGLNQMAQLFAHDLCDYHRIQGIGNNIIMNNIKFIGRSTWGLNRIIILSMPQNFTFSNNLLLNMDWSFGSYGFSTGYTNLQNPCLEEISEFKLIYENNLIINSRETPLVNLPFTINNDQYLPSIQTKIIFRGNVFSSINVGMQGLIYINCGQMEQQFEIIIENNIIEYAYHPGTGLPLIYANGDSIIFRNNTIKDSVLSKGVYISSPNAQLYENTFDGIDGGNIMNSLLTIEFSMQPYVQKLTYSRCNFNSMRALEILYSRDVLIEYLSVTDSNVSNNHIMYITQVLRMHFTDTMIARIRRAQSFIGDVRVLEIGTLEPFVNKITVNQITVRNLTYVDSEMSFFQYQKTLGKNPRFFRFQPTVDWALSGDISIFFINCTFERISLSGKDNFFTTQDILLKSGYIKFQNIILQNNYLEQGYMFYFNHNFRLVNFIDCLIQNNDGYFLIMNPSEKLLPIMQQYLRFQRVNFLSNSVRNYAMLHVMGNCQLDIFFSLFEKNIGFGRGVIVYAEMEDSFTYVESSGFVQNRGYQGGIIYAELQAVVTLKNNTFQENFAFEGGVAFLQNEANLRSLSDSFYRNIALRASIFIVYNVNEYLYSFQSFFTENGFLYSKDFKETSLILDPSSDSPTDLIAKKTFIQNFFFNNIRYLEFYFNRQDLIRTGAIRNQYTDNAQIQIIKGRIVITSTIVIKNQLNFLSAVSWSKVNINSVQVYDIYNIQTPFLQVDQSEVLIENINIFNTQGVYPRWVSRFKW